MSNVIVSSAATGKPPRPRRWIPRSLRLFAAILTLLGVGSILWIGISVWLPYHSEQQVIQKVEGWGGRVGTETRGPEWLREIVGESRMKEFKVFDKVDAVFLDNTEVTDAEIAHLSKLKNLKWLGLTGTAVTNAGLAHLSGLTDLDIVDLCETNVTDAGLAHLSGLRNLENLYLYYTAVTDKGVQELSKALPNCKIRH